jgi:hypothetical protein
VWLFPVLNTDSSNAISKGLENLARVKKIPALGDSRNMSKIDWYVSPWLLHKIVVRSLAFLG